MMLILEREELEWLNELRNGHMAIRLLFRMYDSQRIEAKDFIERLRKDFDETGKILLELSKRGM